MGGAPFENHHVGGCGRIGEVTVEVDYSITRHRASGRSESRFFVILEARGLILEARGAHFEVCGIVLIWGAFRPPNTSPILTQMEAVTQRLHCCVFVLFLSARD